MLGGLYTRLRCCESDPNCKVFARLPDGFQGARAR